MSYGRIQFLKPRPATLVVFAVLAAIIWLGAVQAAVIFGHETPPPGAEVLMKAPWWQMSLVAGLPGHLLTRLVTELGVPMRSWTSGVIYGVTVYLTAALLVEMVTIIRSRRSVGTTKR